MLLGLKAGTLAYGRHDGVTVFSLLLLVFAAALAQTLRLELLDQVAEHRRTPPDKPVPRSEVGERRPLRWQATQQPRSFSFVLRVSFNLQAGNLSALSTSTPSSLSSLSSACPTDRWRAQSDRHPPILFPLRNSARKRATIEREEKHDRVTGRWPNRPQRNWRTADTTEPRPVGRRAANLFLHIHIHTHIPAFSLAPRAPFKSTRSFQLTTPSAPPPKSGHSTLDRTVVDRSLTLIASTPPPPPPALFPHQHYSPTTTTIIIPFGSVDPSTARVTPLTYSTDLLFPLSIAGRPRFALIFMAGEQNHVAHPVARPYMAAAPRNERQSVSRMARPAAVMTSFADNCRIHHSHRNQHHHNHNHIALP